jgi:asparagine synthase (glutamine-hydrolysing)
MCGIAGFYSYNNFCSEQELRRMTDVMVHRGPDATGYYVDSRVGLGHRRLSIIDLSEAANQPMFSHDNRYIIIYNGEVYNFKEIAAELNIKLKTASDTEVILEAFAKWGADCVDKFNGMFAIAIYDKENKELHLFRDRVGIKPLFYYRKDNEFAFASEIKALNQIDKIRNNTDINHKAVSEFLYLGYIPQPHTIYKDIHKFPEGCYGKLTKNSFEIKSYWKAEDYIKKDVIKDLASAKKRLDELLNKSVQYRLISDVPYGVFLSGGIDSSLVTAVARKLTDRNLKTFSIGFKESKYNEAGYAKAISDYLQTDHHELIVSQNDALDLVDDIIGSYDEPYADSSALPTMIVSKMARQNVTMVLSGDGGDELFHGYGAYLWAKRLSNPLVKTFRKPIAYGLSMMDERMQRASHMFKYISGEQVKSNTFSQEQYLFSETELGKILTQNYRLDIKLEESYDNLPRTLTSSEQQALFDLNYYLKDDLLVKIDRASMKYSLETRVPLLDYNIIEFALNISPDLKINHGVLKYLLKELAYDYIPKKYFDRPKWGFAIPLSDWLKNELRFLIDEYLSEQIVKKHNFVHYNLVSKLKLDYLQGGKNYFYNRIWALIILHKWAEMQ